MEIVRFEERDKVHVSKDIEYREGRWLVEQGSLWVAKGNRKGENESFIGRSILGSECG